MAGEARYCDWVAVDWGSSHLRAWAMRGDAPLAELTSDDGGDDLAPEAFEPVLLRLIAGWLGAESIDIMACGMVGSYEGWVEARYRAVPCTPAPEARKPTLAPAEDPRLNVQIVPGLCQTHPPDVMRGEETQIAGWLADHPDFDGVLCLPGTHSKWAQISAGEVVSFRTAMTGELFDVLAHATVLRHTVADRGWDEAAFCDAVSDVMSRPEAMSNRLFGLRAGALLAGLTPNETRARLSGLLIGAELADTRPYWLGQRVVLVGEAKLEQAYATALRLQGVVAETAIARDMTMKGLAAIRRHARAAA